MEKRSVTIQLPAITAKWLKEHLISSPITTVMEDELQKAITIITLSSAIGGQHEQGNN
jgi:hypothetical protein